MKHRYAQFEVAWIYEENGQVEVTSVGVLLTWCFKKNVAGQFDIEAHGGGQSRKHNYRRDNKSKAKYWTQTLVRVHILTQTGIVGNFSTVHGCQSISN